MAGNGDEKTEWHEGSSDVEPSSWSLEGLLSRWLNRPVDGADAARIDELGPRYQLGDVLGRGGMGEVRRARDRRLRRDVAIKTQRLSGPDGAAIGRFLQEAQVTGQLAHPNIPPIHDLGVGADGLVFFTMRALPGRTLQQVLKQEGALPPARAVVAFGKICDAVAYAHDRGVLHRDLKPGNIVIGEFGEVYVIDWGLAKTLDRPASSVHTDPDDSGGALTRAGNVLGTPGYMSPEQAAGAPLDERSDVYGLGAVLYAMLIGRSPFQGTPHEILMKANRGELPPPRRLRRDLPWELDRIVMRAMSLRPEARYPTVGALQSDLAAWQDGRLAPGLRYGLIRRASRTVGRHRRALVGTAAAVLGAGTLLVGMLGLNVLTLTLARDRALDAERLAELRALDQQVALARFRGERGQTGRAGQELMDAARRAAALGADDRPAWFAAAELDDRHLPPELVVGPDLSGAVLDPAADRIALLRDRGVAVVDLLSGERSLQWRAPDGDGRVSLAGFRDGRLEVLLRDGARVSLFDVSAGREDWSLTLDDPEAGVMLSSDGTRAAVVSGGRTRFVRLPDGGEAAPPLDGSVVRLSADGARAIVARPRGAGAHRQIERHELVEVATGRVLGGLDGLTDHVDTADLGWVFQPGPNGVRALRWDGTEVWSGGPVPSHPSLLPGDAGLVLLGDDGRVELRDPWTGEVRQRQALTRFTTGHGAAVGHGWIASREVDELHLWGLADQRGLRAHDGVALAVTASPDGEVALTAGWDGTIATWDWRSRRLLRRYPVCADGVRDVALSPDGTRAATADRCGRLRVVDLATGEITTSIDPGRGIGMGVDWRGDGRLVSAWADGAVLEHDLADGSLVRELKQDLRTGWGLALAGDRLVVSGRDEQDPAAELWDLSTGARLDRWPSTTAYGVALSDDGRSWAVGTGGQGLWARTPEGDHVVEHDHVGVMAAAFGDGDRLLVAGLFDGRIAVHDRATGAELLVSQRAPAGLQSLTFVPGTRTLLVVTEDGALDVLDLDGTARLQRLTRTIPDDAEPPPVDRAAVVEQAELRRDWTHAREALRRADEAGVSIPLARRLRILRASGETDAARAALDAARPGELSAGTAAAWRGALGP